jgi:hypoxanthine phosphoribosyltransferase
MAARGEGRRGVAPVSGPGQGPTSTALRRGCERIVYSEETIRRRVETLGRDISQHYSARGTEKLMVLGLLKGSFIFLADLVRAIQLPLQIDFLVASSYGSGQESSGEVSMLYDPSTDLSGRDVLLVEDIVDSGTTLESVGPLLRARGPASLEVCALLHKRARPCSECEPRWIGFEAPDEFLVGYGLDHAEDLRHLPFIGSSERGSRRSSSTRVDRSWLNASPRPQDPSENKLVPTFPDRFVLDPPRPPPPPLPQPPSYGEEEPTLRVHLHGVPRGAGGRKRPLREGHRGSGIEGEFRERSLGTVRSTPTSRPTSSGHHRRPHRGDAGSGRDPAGEPEQTPWWTFLISALPWIILILFWFWLIRMMQGGGNKAFQFGRSKAKLISPDTPKVTFEDVAGADEAKHELEEIIEFLKDPRSSGASAGGFPRGCSWSDLRGPGRH